VVTAEAGSRSHEGESETEVLERVGFKGHPLVSAIHPTTLELTKEEDLTSRGDCVIGVNADKAASDLDPSLKRALRTKGARVRLTLEVGRERFWFRARGDRALSLDDTRDIVIRRSKFISRRTLAIGAEAAAKDIPRGMVENLKKRKKGVMTIEVWVP